MSPKSWYLQSRILKSKHWRSVRTPQDASNEPAVEPPLADAKPAEAAEAVEVPWEFAGLMGKATNI